MRNSEERGGRMNRLNSFNFYSSVIKYHYQLIQNKIQPLLEKRPITYIAHAFLSANYKFNPQNMKYELIERPPEGKEPFYFKQ